jgi:two-component system C4-dicarboxylate transport sensor histidine kinase DctB
MLQRPAAAPAQVLSSTPEQLGKRARRVWLLFAAAALAITSAAL